MTRTRLFLTSTTALASMLGAALPALAQAPMMAAPPPMMAPPPAPVMAPMMAPAPGPEAMVMPMPPVVAPKPVDDMTGSVGLGVGVGAGTSLIVPDTNQLTLRYWMSDALSIEPWLQFGLGKSKGSDASWGLRPGVLANFVMLKGASTRLTVGIGLGFSVSKLADPETKLLPADTTLGIYIPASLGVEHYFTRWFSMGIAMTDSLFSFSKTGSAWSLGIDVSTFNYMGSLFFYTD
jgi:hypothetical protein